MDRRIITFEQLCSNCKHYAPAHTSLGIDDALISHAAKCMAKLNPLMKAEICPIWKNLPSAEPIIEAAKRWMEHERSCLPSVWPKEDMTFYQKRIDQVKSALEAAGEKV